MADSDKSRRLGSWKEIAGYLNVDVRTAQRYEERDGLPIYRQVRGSRGSVQAIPEEVDAWVRGRHRNGAGQIVEAQAAQPGESGNQLPGAANSLIRTRWLASAIALVALTAGGYLVWHRAKDRPIHRSGVLSDHARGRYFAEAAAEGGQIRTVSLEESPTFLAFHPSRRELYVSCINGQRLLVFSTDTWQVAHRLPVGGGPGKPVFLRNGREVMLTTKANEVVVVNTETQKVIDRIDIRGIQLRDLIATPDGLGVYIASPREGVLKYEFARRQFTPIPGLVCPWALWLDPAANLLYVASRCGGPGGTPGHDAVDIVDLRSGKSLGAVSGPPMVAGTMVSASSGASLWIEGTDACRSPYYDHIGCPIVPGDVFHLFRTADRKFMKTMAWPGGTLNRVPVPHPDERRVVFIHGADDIVEVVNGITFRTVESLAIRGAVSAAISPDGAHLVIAREKPPSLVVLKAVPETVDALPGEVENYWSGDGTKDDSAGYSHLQAVGDVGYGPGVSGQAFRLDGSSSLLAGPAWKFAMVAGSKSLAAWVKPGVWSGEMPVLSSLGPASGWRSYLDSHGRMILETETIPRSTLTSRTIFQPGSWHHFIIERSQSELQMYIDGRLESSKPGTVTPGQGLAIGSNRTGNSFFRGLIDEIVIHNGEMSAAVIQRLSGPFSSR